MFGRPAVSDALRQELTSVVESVLKNAADGALRDFRDASALQVKIKDLRQSLETLEIEKGRKDEDYAKKDREVEHKIGLERKRQEFELEQAKREVTVSVREENLKADRTRFEEQMKFHNDRFTTEVGYLKDMIGQMLVRLPEVKVAKRG